MIRTGILAVVLRGIQGPELNNQDRDQLCEDLQKFMLAVSPADQQSVVDTSKFGYAIVLGSNLSFYCYVCGELGVQPYWCLS